MPSDPVLPTAEKDAWVDKHGDVWRLGPDGLMHTPETAPFPREHVEKKWGPLRLARVIPPGEGKPMSDPLPEKDRDALADTLGDLPRWSYNVFDATDEAETWIKAPVDVVADALAPTVAAMLAAERERAEAALTLARADELRRAADAWESEPNDVLMRIAEKHYRAGGPSLPTIYLRLRADRLERSVREAEVDTPEKVKARLDALRTALDAPTDSEQRAGSCDRCSHSTAWHTGPMGCIYGWESDNPATSGCRCRPDSEPTDESRIEALIERSSLGTPAAKAARASVSAERAARVVARAEQLRSEPTP